MEKGRQETKEGRKTRKGKCSELSREKKRRLGGQDAKKTES